MCMQFTLDKNPSGPGARQSATDSAQLVDQIRTLCETKQLAFNASYASR